ncbi:hypothetical protein LMG26411_04000 [Cupriavidus numazuensis]|uniref:Uncharacterized protein n=1 Tax=Cupriavidus numazuensis TaxID=221992 RepID=A0ABN7Q0P5_9BURK|nr:hypothetical protein LMG26411_04000 [Cupriavidus numazuensis]
MSIEHSTPCTGRTGHVGRTAGIHAASGAAPGKPPRAVPRFFAFLFAGKAGCQSCTFVSAAARLFFGERRHLLRYGARRLAGRNRKGGAQVPRIEGVRGQLAAIAVLAAFAAAAGVFYTLSWPGADPGHPCGPAWCLVEMPNGEAVGSRA